ncbi:UDP-N-acetylmuramoyl-L-alanyl-D-glutamate--2,6-diaminopimelate ligase [Aquisalimonas asiatica]|uniref:UDP-N-acetylmuramoyl-L-alanyl-D-glutamate--2,6-diaminopimelate ligase n=1 Tax=Aquisalimonas asiatica TaxID=406100 RepID=A0A1H8S7W9_9GAMM|nr:UDP-N-acetylmuramoyl-L-alanyl-D-glutamate--2,6-diaminopimelate ligase [Aquisalimonas asiatica]SEO74725.1 UDP-N-acetylmuramoylalanyl-D-glutamate--2,6-diaminopimelate ligase [Aquisalimonas asiatica]
MSAAPEQAATATLDGVLAGVEGVPPVSGSAVRGITVDSRRVERGFVFAALRGARGHGLDHLDAALQQTPAAVLYDPATRDDADAAIRACADAGVPLVPVPALDARLGEIAARVHGEPASQLCCIGVTGTDGKTSVTQFLAGALQRAGEPCGLLGTLGYGFPEALVDTGMTTPDAAATQALLRELLDRGASHVAMEVSSHALVQHRVGGVVFDTAVLTNLGRDHLDYHGTAEAYADAKRRLFQSQGLRLAVLNLDDALGMRVGRELADAPVQVIGYSMDANASAEIICTSLKPHPDGLRMTVVTPVGRIDLDVPLLGRFNGANLLAVIGTLVGRGYEAARIEAALAGVCSVPGRMEPFPRAHGPLAVVDYAHTPGALQAALAALREHLQGRLWCVFGCGGDRDTGKRPLMAAAAERLADQLVITDDNPRGEDPDAIVSAISNGLRHPGAARIIRDRGEAIATALREAGPGDVVLIAGKGHETDQLTATGRHHFSDRETARHIQAGGGA